MKKIVAFFIFLFCSVTVYACSCLSFGIPFNQYSSSDLVADVTITKVYPAEKKFEKQYYKVDLRYNKIFKGSPVKSMYVYGNTIINGKMHGSFTSCSLGFTVGQKLIIFENKDVGGNYMMHYCETRIKNEDSYKKSFGYHDSTEILRSISSYNITTNFKNFYIDFNFDVEKRTSDLDTLKGLVVKNKFAAYEITINKDGRIEEVKTLQSFLSDKDDEILDIIRKKKVTINPENAGKISNGEKFLFLLFYYPAGKNHKSFISQNYL